MRWNKTRLMTTPHHTFLTSQKWRLQLGYWDVISSILSTNFPVHIFIVFFLISLLFQNSNWIHYKFEHGETLKGNGYYVNEWSFEHKTCNGLLTRGTGRTFYPTIIFYVSDITIIRVESDKRTLDDVSINQASAMKPAWFHLSRAPIRCFWIRFYPSISQQDTHRRLDHV